MTPFGQASPFSNILGTDQDSSTFKDVESTEVSDTTSETAGRPADRDADPSGGTLADGLGDTHESGQDETQGQTDTSGNATYGT